MKTFRLFIKLLKRKQVAKAKCFYDSYLNLLLKPTSIGPYLQELLIQTLMTWSYQQNNHRNSKLFLPTCLNNPLCSWVSIPDFTSSSTFMYRPTQSDDVSRASRCLLTLDSLSEQLDTNTKTKLSINGIPPYSPFSPPPFLSLHTLSTL